MVHKYMYDKYLKIEEVKEELKKKYESYRESGDFYLKNYKEGEDIDEDFRSLGICMSHYASCISMIYKDLFHEKIESEDK